MNKTTIYLPGQYQEWGSYISKYQPDFQKVLDNMFTAGSKNFITDQTGMIDKRQGGVKWNRTTFSGPAQDSFEAVFSSGARHYLRVGQGVLTSSVGNGLFVTITSGYAATANFEWANYQDRVYGDNGINDPQVYDIATVYGGVTYSFTNGKTKVMGAQAPVTAPTAGTPTAGGSVPNGSHTYKVTFMYYGSEESNGSPASAAQTAGGGNNTIPLTNLPIGGYGVTARNIYRDNNDGIYVLLTTIGDNTTTTFTDTIGTPSTPTPIPTDHNVPPPFTKIALFLDRLWIIPTGTNQLLYSNAGSPDIFPPTNRLTTQTDDVATAVTLYNGKLYVHGLHSFGSIEGTTPDTFYYNNISNRIGCVDNRSIQIRSIVSVPVLWWLSDKGLYYSNGYTVEYGSDLIQDLVNLNLAQVNYSTNKNTQDNFTEFSADTITPGIDLLSDPGVIQTINPKSDYSHTADWLGGSVVTNVKTADDDLAEVPIQDAPPLGTGVLGGDAIISAGNITMPTSTDFTGQSGSVVYSGGVGSFNPGGAACDGIAQKITPPRSGTLTHITFPGIKSAFSATTTLTIWSDSGGKPNAIISAIGTFNTGTFGVLSTACSVPLTGGTSYWIVAILTPPLNPPSSFYDILDDLSYTADAIMGKHFGDSQFSPGSWANLIRSPANTPMHSFCNWTFVSSPIAQTGTWTSPIYDCGAVSSVPATLSVPVGSYPFSTGSSILVSTSASPTMSTPNTQTFINLAGPGTLTLTGLRYWTIAITVSTSDDRVVPIVGPPTLVFSTTATWVSQPIHATTDNTGWGLLTFAGTVPMGTSVTLTIATSTDNIAYSTFGPIGSAATTEWAKVRFDIVADSTDSVSPSISDLTLTWTLSSTITSTPIDAGIVPVGFSTMQFVQTNPGVGTVSMYIRTASSSGGLVGATYVLVPNGTFPSLTPLEFMQWKLVLTSSADASPMIISITVNWFISTGPTGVRCASLFFNKTYYLSVAMISSPNNNLLIELDQFGKWRIQKDASVGTMLLFFNTLYFTDGLNGNIYNGFIAPTDNGTPIVMDIRTKAWFDKDNIFLKIPRGLKVTGLHTGTTIHAFYSIDRGNTWVEMLNEQGVDGFITNNGGLEFVVLFVPDATTLLGGRTLMYRITSNDEFPCSIINFEPSMYARRARFLDMGVGI